MMKNEAEKASLKHKSTLIYPLNVELNLICHLLALLGGANIVVVSRLRVNISASRLVATTHKTRGLQ